MRESISPTATTTLLDLEKTASFLGISPATVKNWVKCGYMQTHTDSERYFFHLSEVENIKNNITNGTLNKLNGRANKIKGEKIFTPIEYLKNGINNSDFIKIINFIIENQIDISISLLLLSLNWLKKERIISKIDILDLIKNKDLIFINDQISQEINSWLSEIKITSINTTYDYLLNCPLSNQRDFLGFIYQSLLFEGKKSQNGSYYTPESIVNEIVNDYAKSDSKILDPCCGTGQFLLAFADIIKNPTNIYGIDTDAIAIKIARLNLLVKFKNVNFIPNIVCKNTLFEIGNNVLFRLNNDNFNNFDIIATNPPWGAHFSLDDVKRLKLFFPEITSSESFSYFLKKSLDLLRDGGIISFILPESILNVKTHKDIREIILDNTYIKKIQYLYRVFKNVFTPVIRIDLEKKQTSNNQIIIVKDEENYTAKQATWRTNRDFIFNIHTNNFDAVIIDKIFKTPHTTLAEKADWALGIVTGNNKVHIISDEKNGYEEIYKGKDIKKFVLNKPSNYIQFMPEKFQQVAPIDKYRAKEKLIYKFISKHLVFAYDDKQRLTLNSANILIPKIPNYPIKVIAALLNSSLYQFVFQKKFSTIKILRGHIEQMPMPLWDKKVFTEIERFVDDIIKNGSDFKKLDDYIFNKYLLSTKEIDYIINSYQ